MGLARTDTQDTEDGWVDTINRLPSAIDLWTGNYDRSMFPNKEEFLTSSTEDQIEENKWERETEDLNYEQCKDDLPDDLLSDEDTVIEPRKSAEEHASAEINNTSHSTSSILLDETKGQSNSADTEIVTKGHDENCVPDSLLESPSSTTDDPNAANDATDKSINTEQSVLHSDDSNSRHSNKETMTEEEPPEVESAKQAPIAEQSQNSETINDGSITSTVPNQQDDINISHISTSTVVIASTGPLETKSDDDCNADPTLLNVNKWVEESEFQNMPSDSDDNRADAGSTLVATSKTIDGVNEHNTDTPSSSQEPDEADPNNEHISETATACSEGVIRTYSQETLLLNLNSQEIIDSGSSHTVDSVNEFQLHHSPDSSSKSVNISTAIEDTVPEESDIDKIEAPSKDTEHLENSLSKTDLQTIEKKTANNALLDYSNSPDLFESVPISEESIINNVTNEEIVEQPLQNVNNSNENILLNIRDDNAISSAQNKSLSSEDERMLLSPVSETDTILASMPSPSNNEKDAEVTTSEVVAPTDGGLVDSTTADVNKNQDECSKTDVADTTTVTSSEETSQETVILKGDKIENNAVLPDVPCTDCSESRTKEFIPAPNVTPETVSEKNIPSEEEDTLTQNTISLVGNDDGKAKSNTSDTDDTVFNEDATLVENEPASIVTDNTESCSERSVEKETGSKEETRLSQDSATSFVFDISDNQNDIGSKSQTDNENCSSTNLRDESVKIDPAEEPINNCSDVDEDDDDDGVHLDVTMEEIICNGSPSYIENYGCQEENVVIKQEDEEIIEETPQNENSAAEGITSDPQQNVGDELLQLLREVEVPFDETVNSSSQSNKPKSNSKQESKEADEILKMLDEETVSDISDSDLSDDNLSLSGFDMDLLEDKLVKEVVDKKFEKSSDYDEKNFIMRSK
ncbi:hypothetical protein NQ315_009494 [Exocentrus adspersus]|uniref:Uncharacterized protein n=1 Tax=Exocentrus adspersus TaxID=1586481 RepID=A0AAV8WGJ4_9CUCU|nr:hypothetical protein NQ315_009494 [Exocentrus adspersus]